MSKLNTTENNLTNVVKHHQKWENKDWRTVPVYLLQWSTYDKSPESGLKSIACLGVLSRIVFPIEFVSIDKT